MSDYLPKEILIEILIKLPVKSLIRLTTVCKSWRSLITTPSFILAHLSSTENQALLRRYVAFLTDNDEEQYSLFYLKNGCFDIYSSKAIPFPFKSQIGFYRIVGSCDGLVCLSNDLWGKILDHPHPVIIWNPCIQNHVVLPQTPIDFEKPHNVVLGFGVSDYVYKVVRLVYSIKPNEIAPLQADVFSLSSGRWRRLSGIHVQLRIPHIEWFQVSLKGFVHWIAYEPIMSANGNGNGNSNGSRSSILTFHIADEVFDEMPLPDELATEAVITLSLSKIGESLVVMKYDGEIGNLPCDVWMMKEYGAKESWSRLYRIDIGERSNRVLGFWGSDEAQGDGLVTYNEKTKWVNHLKTGGMPSTFYFDNYKESLLLLGGYRGASDEESSRGAMEGLSLGTG